MIRNIMAVVLKETIYVDTATKEYATVRLITKKLTDIANELIENSIRSQLGKYGYKILEIRKLRLL